MRLLGNRRLCGSKRIMAVLLSASLTVGGVAGTAAFAGEKADAKAEKIQLSDAGYDGVSSESTSDNTVSYDNVAGETVSGDTAEKDDGEVSDNSAKPKNKILEEIEKIVKKTNGNLTKEDSINIARLKKELDGNKSDSEDTGDIQIAEYGYSSIANKWLDVEVNNGSGRLSIGTKEGNEAYTTDNDRMLTYSWPTGTTSDTLLYVGTEPYSDSGEYERNTTSFFYAEDTEVDSDKNIIRSSMSFNGVLFTQELSFVSVDDSGKEDMVQISYHAKNLSGERKYIGVRVMLDTMIVDNDYAPFRLESIGNVTTQRASEGEDIEQRYQVYDNLTAPRGIAGGLLWKDDDERKPDRFELTNWPSVVGNINWRTNYTEGGALGDSAVEVYFDPVAVNGDDDMEVHTYYGVNIDDISGNGDKSNPANISLKEGDVAVYAVDNDSFKGIGDVSITVEDGDGKTVTGTTSNNGLIIFSDAQNSINLSGTGTIKADAEGYKTKTSEVTLAGAKIYSMQMRKSTDMTPEIEAVKLTIDSKETDLLNDVINVNRNRYRESVEDKPDRVKTINIKVRSDAGDGSKYEIFQKSGATEKSIAENETGSFDFKAFYKAADGTLLKTCRIDEKFQSHQSVYVRVKESDGSVSVRKLGLQITDPAEFTESEFNALQLIPEVDLSSLEDESEALKNISHFLWGKESSDKKKLKFKDVPIKVSVEDDGKIRVAFVLFDQGTTSGRNFNGENMDNIEETYDSLVATTGLQRTRIGKTFGGSPEGFQFGSMNFKASVLGYGEGQISDFQNNKLLITVGIIGEVEGSASDSHQFFVGWVPIYLTVEGKAGAGLEVKGDITRETLTSGDFDWTWNAGEFSPSVGLGAEAGVGIAGVAQAGLNGEAEAVYKTEFVEKYHKASVDGKINIHVKIPFYDKKFNLINGTVQLFDKYWDGSDHASTSNVETANLDTLFDTEGFEPIKRINSSKKDDLTVCSSGATISNNAYLDAKPKAVRCGNGAYLFYLTDASDADSEYVNRTKIVYRYKSNNSYSWGDEIPVSSADDHSDYDFDLVSDGTNVHLVYQHANADIDVESSFNENSFKDIIKSMDICYAKFTAGVQDADGTKISGSSSGYVSPRIAVKGTNIFTAWYANSENTYLVNSEDDAEGKTTIYMKSFNGSQWGNITSCETTNATLASFDAGFIGNNGYAAFITDEDGNLMTSSDHSLFVVNEASASASKVTVSANNAQFVKIGTDDALFWYQDGNYHYKKTEGDEITRLFDKPADDLQSDYTVIDDGNGNQKVVWISQIETGSSYYKKVFKAADIVSGKAENTYILDQDGIYSYSTSDSYYENYITELTGYIDDSEKPVMVYQQQSFSSSELSESKIYADTVNDRRSLKIESLDYDLGSVEAGKDLDIDVYVTNDGNKDITDAQIYFDSSVYGDKFDIKAGESKHVSAAVRIPDTSSRSKYEVRIKSDNLYSDSDYNKAIGVNYTDLSVEQSDNVQIIDGTVYYTFKVKNNSKVTAENVAFRVMLGSTDGYLKMNKLLEDPIEAGGSVTMYCPVSALDKAEVAYAVVATDTEEENESNNSEMIAFGRIIPEIVTAKTVGTWKVTFVYDNGEENTEIYTTDQKVIFPEKPYKSGYTFDGWFTAENGRGTQITEGQEIFADVTLYAKWAEGDDPEKSDDDPKKPDESVSNPVGDGRSVYTENGITVRWPQTVSINAKKTVPGDITLEYAGTTYNSSSIKMTFKNNKSAGNAYFKIKGLKKVKLDKNGKKAFKTIMKHNFDFTLQKKNIYSLADIEYKTVDEKGKIKGLKVKSEVGKSIPVKKAEYTFDIGSRLLTFKGDRFEGSVTLP